MNDTFCFIRFLRAGVDQHRVILKLAVQRSRFGTKLLKNFYKNVTQKILEALIVMSHRIFGHQIGKCKPEYQQVGWICFGKWSIRFARDYLKIAWVISKPITDKRMWNNEFLGLFQIFVIVSEQHFGIFHRTVLFCLSLWWPL